MFQHFYQIELYRFSIVRDAGSRGRALEMRSLSVGMEVGCMRPRVVLGGNGLLYYANDEGCLERVQVSSAGLSGKVAQVMVSSRRMR